MFLSKKDVFINTFLHTLREERDSEYARMIQEEIRRCAEEARRREVEDEVSNFTAGAVNFTPPVLRSHL